jgi:hypothetical protein
VKAGSGNPRPGIANRRTHEPRCVPPTIDRNPKVVEKALMNKPSHVSSDLPKKFTRS